MGGLGSVIPGGNCNPVLKGLRNGMPGFLCENGTYGVEIPVFAREILSRRKGASCRAHRGIESVSARDGRYTPDRDIKRSRIVADFSVWVSGFAVSSIPRSAKVSSSPKSPFSAAKQNGTAKTLLRTEARFETARLSPKATSTSSTVTSIRPSIADPCTSGPKASVSAASVSTGAVPGELAREIRVRLAQDAPRTTASVALMVRAARRRIAMLS